VLIGAGLILLSGLAFIWLTQSDQALGAPSQAREINSVVPISVDYPAPQLTMTDLSGKPVALNEYVGSVVLVNNWAIWCPPCKAEMPVLQDYYNDYRHLGFTIIAIESGDAPSEVAEFVKGYGLTFPVWPDPTQSALTAFRNSSLPSSYVIDRYGQVRFAWTGAINREMLDEYITPLMEQ
jgi:peroxiredoxin